MKKNGRSWNPSERAGQAHPEGVPSRQTIGGLRIGSAGPRCLRASSQGSQAGFTEAVGKLLPNFRENGWIDMQRGTPAALLLLAAETAAAAWALLPDV